MEKELSELVTKLKEAAGANLKAVILYGSMTTGEFQPKYSDVNLLCVLERLDAIELEKLNPPVVWWVRQRQPPPIVFTLDALRRSADAFPIELVDIKSSHRVLFGEDVFVSLEVPMNLHRVLLERELRINLIRLRQRYLVALRSREKLLRLMTGSVSTFLTLFRHSLIALGEEAPQPRHEVVDRLAALLGLDPVPFHTILDVREGNRQPNQVDVPATFRSYLEGVTRVVEEVDRRLPGGSKGVGRSEQRELHST